MYNSNRKRQRPQRYSALEFVEAVSDNDGDMNSDDDIVGEAVYDEEYIKQRKGSRKMSSSSEDDDDDDDEEDEYHLEEHGEDDYEEDGDDSMSASEDSDGPPRFKKLPARTRRGKKPRSVGEFQSGLRRSKRATRNRIDYTRYEFSESEPELTNKPGKSNGSDRNSEASDTPGFSMGSEDPNDYHDDNADANDDDNEVNIKRTTVVDEKTKEKEEQSEPEPPIKLNRVEDEPEGGAEERRFLDLNELAPGSGIEDGPVTKDEDTDNV